MSLLSREWDLDEFVEVRKEEAKEEKAEEIAEEFLRDGISKEIVSKNTKLPIERIEEIIKKIENF